MTFDAANFSGFIADRSPAQAGLFPQYVGPRDDFDIIVIGSGMGGGVLADELADRFRGSKRILLLEAGSFLFPTHVYNLCRFPNAEVAGKFACGTFTQPGRSGDRFYIHERPQLNFGGRSVFWSGLIPTLQPWELGFFPERLRRELPDLMRQAGRVMNQSASLGARAQQIVETLRDSDLGADFLIEQTPRALHQPYLLPDGTPRRDQRDESTGVFNTAELLVNQLGLSPGAYHGDHGGLFLLLNRYVEDIRREAEGYSVLARDTLEGGSRTFRAGTVVLAGGSIESPKLLMRSSLFPRLPGSVRALAGRGLTDHPTTDTIKTLATGIGGLPLPRDVGAKIIFYSKGDRAGGRVAYPFNVEMNVNHEYWHLRENDPEHPAQRIETDGPSRIDIKFSFGNCLDDGNRVHPAPPYGYVPEITFRNQNWTDHLVGSRLPALADWHGASAPEVFAVLNQVTHRILSKFDFQGVPCRPETDASGKELWFDQGKGFGEGTVHHAVGTLRMPWKPAINAPFQGDSVVDEDLQVVGMPGLHVCDMSVMPFSSAANPVRALVALALRLADKLN